MNMDFECDDMDLMGLLTEKTFSLRSTFEKLWNDVSDVKVSTSEWHILSRIRLKRLSISDVAREVAISRQATHKCIVSLSEKGLLEILTLPHNKRDRFLALTPFGLKCCEENTTLKKQLEAHIVETLGNENVKQLCDLLKKPWI